jgi:hypothetical protein
MASFDGSFIAPWGANTAKEYATQVGGQLAAAPGQFGQNLANMYGSYNQGYGSYNQALQGLGGSYAQNYAAMANGIGGLAQGLGNTWNNSQANNQAASSAEAARQAAASNLGTAAMTGYSGVAGQGLQAWAQNQNGYQKSLSDLGSANQAAISNLGTGRYGALANLGKSGAAMQVGSDMAGAFSNGGTYSAPYYSAPSSGTRSGGGYDMLNGLRGDINNGQELGALSNGYDAALNSLNSDQEIARNTPRTMVNDAYGALMNFNRMNLDASAGGMNQYYAHQSQNNGYRPGQPIPTGSLLEALAGGYTDSASRIGTVQKDVNSGWSDNKNIYDKSVAGQNDLFDRSIGSTGVFSGSSDPLKRQQQEFAMQDAAALRAKQLEKQRRDDIIAKFGSVEAYSRALAGYDY